MRFKKEKPREAAAFQKVKIEVYIPEEYVDRLQNILDEIGACRLGDYDHVMYISPGIGKWRPLEKAAPFLGEVGKVYSGAECRLEFRCDMALAQHAIRVIEEAHPYEQPVINVIPLLNDGFQMKEG